MGLAVGVVGALGLALWMHSAQQRLAHWPGARKTLAPRDAKAVSQIPRADGLSSARPGTDLETSPTAALAAVQGSVLTPEGYPAEGTEVVLLEVKKVDALSLAQAARGDSRSVLQDLLEQHVRPAAEV
jgi:hypothetical protein